MSMAAVSPSSSPRLPSPPPIAEDQLGPNSPGGNISEEHGRIGHVGRTDGGAARRIRPGTKAVDMAEGPPLVELSDIESAFQLTEHLKALHNSITHPANEDRIVPIDRPSAIRIAQPPGGVDRALWLYELCRFLTQKANSIIVALFADDPPCSAHTCPEMRASEWQYLCAVHDPPKSCCAIDYCCHTLDWAANTLTSPKHFPSRLALGTEANTAHQQVRQLTNIFRRVYRIFAHAWFQHRRMFWRVENETGLYVFFKTVCDVYTLIPEDNYTIPPEAEGVDATPVAAPGTPSILLRSHDDDRISEEAGNITVATGNTTKRHRQTPSSGGSSFSTVIEENEEHEEQSSRKADDVPCAPHSYEVDESDTMHQQKEFQEDNSEDLTGSVIHTAEATETTGAEATDLETKTSDDHHAPEQTSDESTNTGPREEPSDEREPLAERASEEVESEEQKGTEEEIPKPHKAEEPQATEPAVGDDQKEHVTDKAEAADPIEASNSVED